MLYCQESLLGMQKILANNIFFCVCKDNLIQDVLIRFLFEHHYGVAGSTPVHR